MERFIAGSVFIIFSKSADPAKAVEIFLGDIKKRQPTKILQWNE